MMCRTYLSFALAAFAAASPGPSLFPPHAGFPHVRRAPVSQFPPDSSLCHGDAPSLGSEYVAQPQDRPQVAVAQPRDHPQVAAAQGQQQINSLSSSAWGLMAGFVAALTQRRVPRYARRGRRDDEADPHVVPCMATASQIATRRGCLSGAALVAAALPLGIPASRAEEDSVDVYFGCGCFWHVQHEFVEAEKRILGRSDSEMTALVGYAGGRGGARDGKVCYHNALGISEYSSLGHAEVVRMRVPSSKFGLFAEEYFKLFDKDGNRPDQFGDRGPEYRNLVGLPGGTNSPFLQELVQASKKQGDKIDFAKGKGSDKDVPATTFVVDTADFPFYIGEPYHQFHDGFNWGEDYPNSYNSLGGQYVKAGLVKDSGCPNGVLGLGIAGL
mmetsp:Transcript_13376/g.35933  ORF Transcript_13376/g.35933 Transcript_13376/m.35933 type:complete len:385 (+) Transcript_13376:45-1199(+)